MNTNLPDDDALPDYDEDKNGPKTQAGGVEMERRVKGYLLDDEIIKLELKVPFWNSFALGCSIPTALSCVAVNYFQTYKIGESLAVGLSVGVLTGVGVKAFNYFKNERPLKKLKAERAKLSGLEKK